MAIRLGPFYRGLASLIRAGVVMREALRTLRVNRTIRGEFADSVESLVAQGRPLSEALALHAEFVPGEDVALLAAGEASGRIEETLERLASLHEEAAERARNLFQQCILPLANLHAAALLLPVAFLSLRGRFTLARWAMTVGMALLPLYAGIFLVWRLRRDAAWRGRLRRLAERLPGFGAAARHRRRSRFASVLEAAYDAGIPLDRALSLAGSATAQPDVRLAEHSVQEGTSLTTALATVGIFPQQILGTLATAEQAGDLSPTLRRVALEEGATADSLLRTAMAALARGIGLLVILFVAYFILRFFLEYFGRYDPFFTQ